MPRIPDAQVAPSQLYGTAKIENNLTMGERIRKRFRPTDTVKVHNITSEEISWQWLEEQDETYVIEDGSNIKIVSRETPGLWRLGAGELDVLPGACAYLMIESLYKQTCVLRTGIILHPLDEREIKNFSFDDPQKQEEFIDLVYRGKVTPVMMQQAAMSQLGDFEPKVIQNLAKLPTEKEEYERRTRSNPHAALAPSAGAPEAPQATELKDLGQEFSAASDDPKESLVDTASSSASTENDKKQDAAKPSAGAKNAKPAAKESD